MAVSTDFEKQQQYFDKKYCFIFLSLVKIARLTRVLLIKIKSLTMEETVKN
jgi:hypothetical protein